MYSWYAYSIQYLTIMLTKMIMEICKSELKANTLQEG